MDGPRRAFFLRISLPVALALLLAGGLSPAAAAGGAEAVDFPTAVARALANNPGLSAAAYARAAAASDADAARAPLLPSLLFEEKFVRTNIPADAFGLKMNEARLLASDFADVSRFNDPPPINDFIASVSLSQMLFAPKAWLGARVAGRESEATGLDLVRAREEAVYRVLAAYLRVLSARESLTVARQGVDDAGEHVRAAEAVERAGLGLYSDVLRAKVFLAQAEGARVTAEARHALAQKGLGLAMGEKGGTSVDAAAPVPPFGAGAALEERIARATAARPDLTASSLRVANAGTRVDLSRADYLPEIGIAAAWQADSGGGILSPDNRSWKLGVGLSWNLFDGLRREAAVARARAERGRAREELRGATDRAAFQVTQAHLAVGEAERRLEIARAAADAAEEGLRLVKARYANQLARMVDLVDAQAAVNAARADRVRAGNDLLQARGDLEFATGSLLSWASGGAQPEKGGAGR